MTSAQKSKFLQWIDYRVRVTIQDNRMIVGTFLAFDKHLNVVLSDTEEFRRVKPKKQGEPEREIKRVLGMIILRGDNIVSITAETPPSQQAKREMQATSGKATAITRQGQAGPGPQQVGQMYSAQPELGTQAKGVGQPMNMMPPNLPQPPKTQVPPPNVVPPNILLQQQGAGQVMPPQQPRPQMPQQPGIIPPNLHFNQQN